MTDTTHDDDPDPKLSTFGRRVWPGVSRLGPASSNLALAAMAILYDAGSPLTRDELAERLIASLHPAQVGYLKSWYLRTTALKAKSYARRKSSEGTKVIVPSDGDPNPIRCARYWIGQIFVSKQTQRIERLPDGRIQPGPKAPKMLTVDGRRVAYTPEARKQLEQDQADGTRLHVASIDMIAMRKVATTPDACAQLLTMILRRRAGRDTNSKKPFNEHALLATVDHFLSVLNTPSLQRRALEPLIAAIFDDTP